MEICMEKRQWQKPRLMTLVRRNPEEAVLTACKTVAAGGASPSTLNFGCYQLWTSGPFTDCGQCSAPATS